MAIAVVRVADNASLWETGRDKGVERFIYLAHPELVKQVCPQCLFYHRTEWRLDDPKAPEPPLHPLCACTREPVFDEGTVLGQDPDGEPIVAKPEPPLKPGEFLRSTVNKLPADEMDRILGPTKGKLIRAGLLDPERDLVTHKSGVRLVDQLLERLGLKKPELKELSYEELRELSIERLGREKRKHPRRRVRIQPGEPPPHPALFVKA